MAKPTVSVALNRDDFYFIMNSIGLNVPYDKEKNAEELRTTKKLRRAASRLRLKTKEGED